MQRKKKMEQLPKRDDVLFLDGETFARMINNYWANEQKVLQDYLKQEGASLTEEGWALAHECYIKGFWQAYKTMSEITCGIVEAEEIANRQV